MIAEPAYVILDTNVVLHFKRANEIDWCALTGSREAVLIITPVFLRELEEEKVHNKLARLRERAAGTIRWLEQLLTADNNVKSIRKNVTLSASPYEPTLNFLEHRLSERIADDQLIANAIEIRNQGKRVFVPLRI